MSKSSGYDAAVVGSGPNGLCAAVFLAQRGYRVIVYEAADIIGGGARTLPLTLPGFRHDVCSAIHPMAVGSPFLPSLPLEQYGLHWIHPNVPLAHPMGSGRTVLLHRSVAETVDSLGPGGEAYGRLMTRLAARWWELSSDAMGPLGVPANPLLLSSFGLRGLQSATQFAHRYFPDEEGRAFFAGLAAHSLLPMESRPSAAIGLMLAAAGHRVGWPFPKGGAQAISDALAAHFRSLGGVIQTGKEVQSLGDVETDGPVLFEVAPANLARICKDALPERYLRKLRGYQQSPGVFKVDWALDAPIPWRDPECLRAGTIHLGSTFDEIARSERAVNQGERVDRPYVLLAQHSLFDDTRAPKEKHTAWAYCHVPNGDSTDMSEEIENQIERFAPGFRDRILGKNLMNCAAFESYNANYIGGDTVGGANTLQQTFFRPAPRLNPYTTPNDRVFLCSASTPPGGGVHGMCGVHAARAVIRRGSPGRD